MTIGLFLAAAAVVDTFYYDGRYRQAVWQEVDYQGQQFRYQVDLVVRKVVGRQHDQTSRDAATVSGSSFTISSTVRAAFKMQTGWRYSGVRQATGAASQGSRCSSHLHPRSRSIIMRQSTTGDVPVAKKVPNPIDVHVGSRVRIRRRELGMSQEKLGDALGLTFQQVQKYEKGTNRISASRLQHVSRILHVAIAYFFEGSPGQLKAKGNALSSAYVSDFVAATDGLALAKAFTQIKNANVRHHIVKLVNEIAGG